MPNERTNKDKVRVRTVKLVIMPRVSERERFLLGVETEKENIIGKTGQIQGEKMVTSPERKAKISRINITNTNYIVVKYILYD